MNTSHGLEFLSYGYILIGRNVEHFRFIVKSDMNTIFSINIS